MRSPGWMKPRAFSRVWPRVLLREKLAPGVLPPSVPLTLLLAGVLGPVSQLEAQTDTVPPAAVTDLTVVNHSASSMTIRFTAPGDNGNSGQADAYDVRYATSPIDSEADFAVAMRASGEPDPAFVQGTRLSDALDYQTGYLARGGEAAHRRG